MFRKLIFSFLVLCGVGAAYAAQDLWGGGIFDSFQDLVAKELLTFGKSDREVTSLADLRDRALALKNALDSFMSKDLALVHGSMHEEVEKKGIVAASAPSAESTLPSVPVLPPVLPEPTKVVAPEPAPAVSSVVSVPPVTLAPDAAVASSPSTVSTSPVISPVPPVLGAVDSAATPPVPLSTSTPVVPTTPPPAPVVLPEPAVAPVVPASSVPALPPPPPPPAVSV